jgi:hypothetical protein
LVGLLRWNNLVDSLCIKVEAPAFMRGKERFSAPGNSLDSISLYPTSMESPPSPCHPDRSAAERRDLQFSGPLVEMFFDRSVATCFFI